MRGGDPAAGDHMEVHQQMLELLAKVRGGPDPTAYTERQLRWEIVDRERWLNSFIPAPIDHRPQTGQVETLEAISNQEGIWGGNGRNASWHT